MKWLRNEWSARLERYRGNDFVRKVTTVLGLDILAKASGFILIPVYLRLMTQEEYGTYNFLVSIVQMVGLLFTLGLYIPQSKLYHSPGTKENRGQLLFTIAITLLGFAILVILPVFLAGIDLRFTGVLFRDDSFYRRYRLILLMAILVTMLGYILTYYLFTTERIRQIRAYNIWRMIFVGLCVLAMLIFRKDAVETRLLFTFSSEFLLILVFSVYFIKETVRGFSYRLLFKCLGMGLPIMFATLFSIIVNFSDKFFLEKYSSLKELSTYYLAFSFASVLPLISASLQNVWMPVFMKETSLERNSQNTRKLILRLVLTFFTLALLLWILFRMLIWMQIIPLKYWEGSYILPLLLLSQIFMAVTTLLNNYLIYFEKTYLIFFSGLLVSAVSLILGRIMIPGWGIYGAANSLLVSNMVYLFVSRYLVQASKRRYMKKRKEDELITLNPVT